ncbi:MAG TPA: amidohydrolase family protein [Gemmatimonadales bacterium]|nr:amidohydrolase family protein [Gemmatimonadales bacterium]
MPTLLTADWVLPVGGSPLRDGGVLLGADGRIAAVGPARELATRGARDEHHPGAALVPGLVNAHTHLELTGLGGQVEEDDFVHWLRRLIELKRARSYADFLAAARRGLADCFASGVTTVADCGDSGAVIEALADGGGRGIYYHEVFGPHPEQVEASMTGLRARVAELRRFEDAEGRVRLGVSPHAPYSVSGPLYAAAAAWARAEGLPLAVHIAESPAERALLADGTGGFAEMWQRRGIPLLPPCAGAARTPVAWLEAHGVLGPDALCIHVVQADAGDIGRLRAHDAPVAHCPLSNRRHGHGRAPLAALRGAGLRVGLGTDSVASVGTLDLFAEARAARALAGLDAEAALALLTVEGARALGLADEIGTLAPGRWGDVAAIALPAACAGPEATGHDAIEAVLAAAPGDVRATWVAGRPVYRAA